MFYKCFLILSAIQLVSFGIAARASELSGQYGESPKDSSGQINLRAHMVIDPSQCSLNTKLMRGAFAIQSGSRFPVSLQQRLDGTKLATGEKVEAVSLVPLAVADYIIAPAGSRLIGWVCSSQRAGRAIEAKLPSGHWLNANGEISLYFNKLELPDGRSLQVSLSPAPQSQVGGSEGDFNVLVNKEGSLAADYHGARYGATGLVISGASIASGPFGLIVGPAVSAVAGAISPSYAFDRPIEHPPQSARAKGFFMGLIKGAPGGFLVTGLVNKGVNLSIPAGAELILQFNQDLVVSAPTAVGERSLAVSRPQNMGSL